MTTLQPLILCMENAMNEEVSLRIEPNDNFQSFLDKARLLLGFEVDINSITRNQPVSLNDNIYEFLMNSESHGTYNLTEYNPSVDETINYNQAAYNEPKDYQSDIYNQINTYNQTADYNKNVIPNQIVGHNPVQQSVISNQPVYNQVVKYKHQNTYKQICCSNQPARYQTDPYNQPANHPVGFNQPDDYNRTIDYNQLLNVTNDPQVYILNDGTQIHASQIHFDNEDPLVDLTAENIPFVKYDDNYSDDETHINGEVINYNIIKSPNSSNGNQKDFINNLPFKLLCNNTGFESQFTKYLENKNKTYTTLNKVVNSNKSPNTLIKDNFKNDDRVCYTREDILNMFKDSPVKSLPSVYTERKHIRKTDPSRVHKSVKPNVPYIDMNGVIIGEIENKSCCICAKVPGEKIYIFDKVDQKMFMANKKSDMFIKVICVECLNEYFKPCRETNRALENNEFLIIRNKYQNIFAKVKNFTFRVDSKVTVDELVNLEIGSDGEIVTKPIENTEVVRESSSDVEIIEEIDTIIDNLDEADDEVKVFLGKYEKMEIKELKCRFCEKLFTDLKEASEHCDMHKHKSDDGTVFPCPLCDYGYPKLKWLQAHMKTAHEEKMETQDNKEDQQTEHSEKQNEVTSDSKMAMNNLEVRMEIKQESVDISDDEIWIVRTADDEAEKQLNELLVERKNKSVDDKYPTCKNCNRIFPSTKSLVIHKCRGSMESSSQPGISISVPTKEDFIKRARGRPLAQSGDNNSEMLPRRKRSKYSAASQIVTCHNCNESFSSKVRLKFHMQFHDNTNLLTPEGKYKCHLCGDVFESETVLFDHVHFQHHKHHKWMCPVQGCGKTFFLRATLTKHSRTHTDTRRYVCVTCGKRFLDKQTLDEHGVTHLQIKPFQCHICLKQLTRRSRLRMHLRAHQEELTLKLVYACAVCGRAFRDAEDAKEHATKSPECIEVYANDLKEERGEIACRLSPTSGLVREAVMPEECAKPSKPISKQVCEELAKPLLSVLPDEIRSIIRVVEIEKAFRCEYCEDVFYLEDFLNSHRIVHKDVENPFTCHICKVSFASYSRCTTHKTTHGFYKRPLQDIKKENDGDAGQSSTAILGYGDFPVAKHFLCEDCGRSYLHWTYLQVHRRMKHSSDNLVHKCSQCDMTFPNSSSMAYHRKKIHGKINPDDPDPVVSRPREDYRIPCRDCDEVLPNKTALYKHRRKEHSNLSLLLDDYEDVFACGNCGKRYSSRARLDTHLNSHTGQNGVATCTKGNSDVNDLQQKSTATRSHRLTYSDDRTWACELCPKRFRVKSNLRAHLRLKHPTQCTIIEIRNSNPSAEELMNILSRNNIPHDRVVEITKMTFTKGTTSVIPTNVRALSMLSTVPRTHVPFGKPDDRGQIFDWQSSTRCSEAHTTTPPVGLDQQNYSLTLNVSGEESSAINLQLLHYDEVTKNSV